MRSQDRHRRVGFTMIELIVVIVIIVIVAVVTVMSFNAVSRNTRLTGAITTVKGALGKGRALAMERNEWVVVVFRSVPNPSEPALVDEDGDDLLSNEQEKRSTRTEILFGQFTGETGTWIPEWPPEDQEGLPPQDLYQGTSSTLEDRYVEIPGAERYLLPRGIKVAGIDYYNSTTANGGMVWATGPELKDVPVDGPNNIDFAAHRWFVVGVMFAPDGTVRTRNNSNSSKSMWMDFNNNGWQELANPADPNGSETNASKKFLALHAQDEPRLTLTMILGVYDGEEARELLLDPLDPASFNIDELISPNGYISQNVDPLYFNRFSGVIME